MVTAPPLESAPVFLDGREKLVKTVRTQSLTPSDISFGDCLTADVDECTLGISGCEQGCVNTMGSYTCTCRDNYELEDNQLGCIGKSKECIIGSITQSTPHGNAVTSVL